jgi:geranylgeranyl diphosphate synthase type I
MTIKSLVSLFLGKIKPNSELKNIDLPTFQKDFNRVLYTYLDDKLGKYKEIAKGDSLAVEALSHAISIIKNGGKRVRPYMCFLAYVTEGGGDYDKILRTSVALELFHAFALIHDDIIDEGLERHGTPTLHVYIEEVVAPKPRGNKKHIAEGIALLAGDLVFSFAHEVMASAENREAQKIFFTMVEEVVAGQMLDVSFMLTYKVDSSTIEHKNVLKTALYSFVNPMLIGSRLAKSSGHDENYRAFGLFLGQAFQIQDDLLDIIGNSKDTGKQTFLDVQEGQHTILSQYIFERASERDVEVLRSLFGKSVDDHGRKVLSRLFESTGSVDFAQKEVTQLIAKARVHALSPQWHALVDLISNRIA